MSEATVDSLYIDHAHLDPPDSLHPPTVLPSGIGRFPTRKQRAVCTGHSPPTARNRVTVSRGTTDARSLSRASHSPCARRAELSHRRERGPRTSCVSYVTAPAPAPSDGSQRKSYTSQQGERALQRVVCEVVCACGAGWVGSMCSATSFTERQGAVYGDRVHPGAAPLSGVGERAPVVEALAVRGSHANG